MRVLIWTQYFWPENFRINDLAVAMQEQGVQVTILTGKPNYPEGRIFPGYTSLGICRDQFAGMEVIRLPVAPRGSGSAAGLVLNYLSFILSGYVLAPLVLRQRDFDVIFVYAPSPLLQALPAIPIARRKRASLVVWVQDLWPESLSATGFIKNRVALKAVEGLVRHIYRCADSILIQSEAFHEPVARLTDNYLKIRYYPNIAEANSHTTSDKQSGSIASEVAESFSVVFAGNIGTAQAMETILKAAKHLCIRPEIKFFVVGGGSREAWLAQEIGRRKLANVVMKGRLPHAEMPAVFAAASALLVTLGDAPALALTIPSKLQAYLAAGRPVIASMNGEGARIVREAEAGLACPAEDADALAAAVLQLYEMTPSERSCLGENGLRYFNKHFEPKTLVRRLIDYFNDTVAQRKENN